MEGEPAVAVSVNGEVHYRQELTREEVVRGWITMPCPGCEGTGICIWHPEYPQEEHGCVECSTSGEVMVGLYGP